MERRLTPAFWNSERRRASAEAGFASKVTSAPSAKCAHWETVSRIASMVSGLAKLGVPPPKYTEVILEPKKKRGLFELMVLSLLSQLLMRGSGRNEESHSVL